MSPVQEGAQRDGGSRGSRPGLGLSATGRSPEQWDLKPNTPRSPAPAPPSAANKNPATSDAQPRAPRQM